MLETSADRLTLRTARPADIPEIWALELRVFSNDRLSRRSLRAFVAADHGPLIAAFFDGRLAGYVLIALRKGARTARLYSIAVDPSIGRRGVGRALVKAGEDFARAHGRASLRLEVRYDNAPAIALYRGLGYRQFGHYEGYYADGAAALRFEKRLAPESSGLTPRG